MENANNVSSKTMPATGGADFSLRGLAIWAPGALVLGVIAARSAVDAQVYFAPLVIFPLLVGVVLGALLIIFMRLAQVGHRPTIIAGMILAGLIAVSGQHFITYLTNERFQEDQSPLVANVRDSLPKSIAEQLPAAPENFFQFMVQQAQQGRVLLFGYKAHGLLVWFSWAFDGLLVLLGIFAVVIPTMLLPFCKRCETWFGTVRSAHISSLVVSEIARITATESVEHIKSGRCRLICCRGGCSPTLCELSWEDASGDTFLSRSWLDCEARDQIMQVLDRSQRD